MDNKLPNDVTSINPDTILQLPMLKEHVTNFTVRNTGPVILICLLPTHLMPYLPVGIFKQQCTKYMYKGCPRSSWTIALLLF